MSSSAGQELIAAYQSAVVDFGSQAGWPQGVCDLLVYAGAPGVQLRSTTVDAQRVLAARC